MRTHHLAAVHGRLRRWTTEDVEAARRLADEEQYPRRIYGRTTEEVWQASSQLTEAERRCRDVVELHRQEISNQRGIPVHEVLDRARQASLDRRAVSRALVALGYLSFLRSDITPPINST